MRRSHILLFGICLLAGSTLQPRPEQTWDCCRPATSQVRYASERYHQPQSHIVRADAAENRFTLEIEAPSTDDGTSNYWVTADHGRTWTRTTQSASNSQVYDGSIEQAPSDSRVVYRVSQDSSSLYLRSNDGGDSWELPKYVIEGVSQEDFAFSIARNKAYHVQFRLAAIHPRDPLTLYAGIRVVQWANSLTRLRPFNDQYLRPIYVSHDGGDTWIKFTDEPIGLRPLGISPSNPKVMYGQGANGVLKSTDGGEHWSPVGQNEALLEPIAFANESRERQQNREKLGKKELEISQFVFDPSSENILYMLSNKGVYRTLDGGKTWCLLNLGFDEVNAVNSLAVNPIKPREIFFGTGYGVFFSADRGCHFDKLFIQRSKQ